MEKIVTKDWLKERLLFKVCNWCGGNGMQLGCENSIKDCPNCKGEGRLWTSKTDEIIILGRALVAIYNNQAIEEQANAQTIFKNGRGFTGLDGKLGTRGAKEFLATNTIPEWLARVWLVEKAGYPRICKYARQLNEIANAKKKVSVYG